MCSACAMCYACDMHVHVICDMHVLCAMCYASDMCSHACAFWIIVAPCTHLAGSCDTHRQAKEICRLANCARTALMANDALAAGV